jgi:hypothetical protein
MKRKTGRLDANESALFLRAAEHVIAQSYDVVYPQYKALQLIPISNEGGPGARTIVYRQFDSVGMTKVVNSYAKDFPRVDVRGREYFQPVKSLGNSYGYNVQELREWEGNGEPIDAKRARAARESMTQKMNKIGWFGETEANLQGLVYHPNVTKAAAVTGTWSSATVDQIMADVNAAIQGPFLLSKGVETVDTCLLPNDKYSKLATTPYSTTVPTFLLDILKAGNPGVLFAPVFELGALAINPRTGAASATNVILTYRRDAGKLFLSIPQDFESFPPQEDGLDWIVYNHGRIAGVIAPYPLSVRVTDGI